MPSPCASARSIRRVACRFGLLAGLLLPAGCATQRTQPSFANSALDKAAPAEAVVSRSTPLRFQGESGPTLVLDHGEGASPGNPIGAFMYFVPLISPEPVAMSQSAGNSQRARVLSRNTRYGENTFSVACEFEISGEGHQESSFLQQDYLHRNQGLLDEGKTLEKQLAYIRVEGSGKGTILIQGVVSNDTAVVTGLNLVFSDQGQPSPVTIGIQDYRKVNGMIETGNELIARVERLSFNRTPGPPRMGVTVDSINRRDARNNLWQRLKGNLTAAAANMLIQPIPIETAGNEGILNFGLALAAHGSSFTFPRARNLRDAE